MEGPRQCNSGLAESRASRTKLSSLRLLAIKNRPSSDIGREFGGDARELGRSSNQRRPENIDPNCLERVAYDQHRQLEVLKGRGLLTRVPFVRKPFQHNKLQFKNWRRRELHPRPEKLQ